MKDKDQTHKFFERSPPEVKKIAVESLLERVEEMTEAVKAEKITNQQKEEGKSILANTHRLIRQLKYHIEQVEKAQYSDDEDVSKRFQDAMRQLMKNVKSDEDIKTFTKSLDAAFYRLRKGGDEKGAAVIRAVRRLLKEVDPGMWVDIWPVWEFENKEDE